MRFAELKPELPASIFPRRLQSQEQPHGASSKTLGATVNAVNQPTRSSDLFPGKRFPSDEFHGDEIDDEDLIAAGKFFFFFRDVADAFQWMRRSSKI
jgi:hypothetical protein